MTQQGFTESIVEEAALNGGILLTDLSTDCWVIDQVLGREAGR